MRIRGILTAFAALAVALVAAPGPGPTAHADGKCVTETRTDGTVIVWRCDHWFTTARPRGSIALVGDSVLEGSSPELSAPSLPDLLAAQGWGPIRMTTALGMAIDQPSTPAASGVDVLDVWKTDGTQPRVVAINLGGDHLGACDLTTVSACKALIDTMLGKVWALWPTATVWWAKVVQRGGRYLTFTDGMKAWNAAMDLAAREHPGRLVLWDWPTALASSDIAMDIYGIHAATAQDYSKRSALIADHLATYMPARYVGPRVSLPPIGPSALEFVPQRNTSAGSMADVVLAANVARTIDVTAGLPSATDTKGVVLTATSVDPVAAGRLKLYPCGRSSSPTALLYFGAGRQRSTQAVLPLTNGTSVCAISTVDVTLRLGVQGALAVDGGDTFTPRTPVPATVAVTATPGVYRVTHSMLSGADAAAATLTVDGASDGGRVTLHACGATSLTAPTVAFSAGTAATSSAFVPVTNGAICLATDFPGTAPRIRVGLTGVFTTATTGARFRFAGSSSRLLDMRPATRRGGWYGRHVVRQALDLPAGPPEAVAVTGAVTVYDTRAGGQVTVQPKGAAGVGVPGVAFNGGVAAAVAPVTLWAGPSRTLLLAMIGGNAQTAFDLVGWWVP